MGACSTGSIWNIWISLRQYIQIGGEEEEEE